MRNLTRIKDPKIPIMLRIGRAVAMAVRAVKMDHQITARVRMRLAPHRSPSHPPGIWHKA